MGYSCPIFCAKSLLKQRQCQKGLTWAKMITYRPIVFFADEKAFMYKFDLEIKASRKRKKKSDAKNKPHMINVLYSLFKKENSKAL